MSTWLKLTNMVLELGGSDARLNQKTSHGLNLHSSADLD